MKKEAYIFLQKFNGKTGKSTKKNNNQKGQEKNPTKKKVNTNSSQNIT